MGKIKAFFEQLKEFKGYFNDRYEQGKFQAEELKKKQKEKLMKVVRKDDKKPKQ